MLTDPATSLCVLKQLETLVVPCVLATEIRCDLLARRMARPHTPTEPSAPLGLRCQRGPSRRRSPQSGGAGPQPRVASRRHDSGFVIDPGTLSPLDAQVRAGFQGYP